MELRECASIGSEMGKKRERESGPPEEKEDVESGEQSSKKAKIEESTSRPAGWRES